jgi:hypothetical protein
MGMRQVHFAGFVPEIGPQRFRVTLERQEKFPAGFSLTDACPALLSGIGATELVPVTRFTIRAAGSPRLQPWEEAAPPPFFFAFFVV